MNPLPLYGSDRTRNVLVVIQTVSLLVGLALMLADVGWWPYCYLLVGGLGIVQLVNDGYIIKYQ